jgi:hypothetical protein
MVSKVLSLLALSGAALAQYTNGTASPYGQNATTASTKNSGSSTKGAASATGPAGSVVTNPASGNTNSSALATEKAFCSFYDVTSHPGRGYGLGGETFEIDCAFAREGLIIEIDISISIKKRAATPQTLPDCINTCVAFNEDAKNDGSSTRCLATSLDRTTFQCTYYSTIGAEISPAPANIDYAEVLDLGPDALAGAGSPASSFAGSAVPLTTSVVPASTHTYTIYSCAATVTDCPYNQVATSVVDAYTTVCPGNVATSGLAAPVACTSCPGSASVVTVYSASSSGTVTSYVPVATNVINVATPTATITSAVALTTTIAPYTSANATSSVVAFTGAAGHVEAGMGMAAIIGAAALLI